MSLIKFGVQTRDFPSLFSNFLNRNWCDYNFDDVLSSHYVFTDVPLVNTKETATEYILEVLAPKLDANDLKIELEENILHLSTDKQWEDNPEDTLRQEFKFSYVNRSFKLPSDVDTKNITATSEKGIILIRIPKKEPKKPSRKVIEIQ